MSAKLGTDTRTGPQQAKLATVGKTLQGAESFKAASDKKLAELQKVKALSLCVAQQ